MKAVKAILDTKNALVGFVMEGTEKEFGSFGDKTIQKPVQLSELIRIKFHNSQFDTSSNRLKELGDFRITELPTMKFDGTDLTDCDASIKLISRILYNGDLVGFEIEVDGQSARYRYEDVLRLASYLKPGNFVVRRTENKSYIAGKPGVLQLETLPEINMGEDAKKSKRKRTSTGGEATEVVQAKKVVNVKDLLSLYEILRKSNGVVIKLPKENYIVTTERVKQAASEFTPINIGEIGSPYISFGEANLNANTTFKKVGTVSVPIPSGGVFPVFTYTWSTKTIFFNGENHMKRFAIAADAETIKMIKKEYEPYMAIRELTDDSFTNPIMQITGRKDFVFLEVDTSKLSIISPEKAQYHMMHAKDIRQKTFLMLNAKVINKYIKGAIGEVKEMADAARITLDSSKKYFGIFEGLSEEYITAIKNAGIDVFTGAYTRTEDYKPAYDKPENPEGVSEGSEKYGMEYGLKKANPDELTYKVMSTGGISALYEKDILATPALQQFVDTIQGIQNIKERYKVLLGKQREVEEILREARTALWAHKIAMVSTGAIHKHDRDMWVQNVKSRVKGFVYDCQEEGCEDLYLILRENAM